jgi:hypothetical protein
MQFGTDSERLIVMAYAGFAGEGRTGAPRSEIGTVGWISPVDATKLHLPGIAFDLTPYQTIAPDLGEGDLVAVEYLSFAQDVSPYLHRAAIPGHPELNQMEVALDMGGNDIVDVAALSGISITADTLEVAEITGDVTINNGLSVAGLSTFAGALSVSGDVTVAGALSAQDITVGGALNADTLLATTLRADDLDVATSSTLGAVEAESLVAGDLVAGAATIPTLSLNFMEVSEMGVNSELRADTFWTRILNVEGCTGC